MHYANGREAKVGDRMVGKDACQNPIGGIVVSTTPESDRCNLNVALTGAPVYTATASECLHVDDIVLAEKSQD